VATLWLDGELAEHLLGVLLGTDTHVLLAKGLDVFTDVVPLLNMIVSSEATNLIP